MHQHSHSHLHRREAGFLQRLGDFVDDLQNTDHGLDNDNNRVDGGNNENNNGGRSNLDHLGVRDSNNQPGNGQGSVATAFSIVYVTATPTFSGSIAGFTTIGVKPSSSAPVVVPPKSSAPVPSSVPSSAPSSAPPPSSSPAPVASSSKPTEPSPTSSLLTSIQTSASDSSSPSVSVASSTSVSSPSATFADSASATTQPSTVITNNDTSSNSGLSGGAKAGIAIGVIIAVLAIAAGVFALLRMRKRRAEDAYIVAQNPPPLSEKNPFSDQAAAPPPSSRQMQQQAPVLPPVATPIHDVERRAESPVNPFGPGAETVRNVSSSAGPAPGLSAGGTDRVALGAGTAAAASGVVAATIAKRTSVPAPLKISRSQSPALVVGAQPSPAASNFSETSMASSAVASSTSSGTVPKMHRVQMDFNPTMDDELNIHAGEIVEILHEYDDGWCLCKIVRRDKEGASRVDRGVAPRTCLSRLPLKPRNGGQKRQGPPVIATSRAESPVAAPTPATSNAAPRSMSPALNANPNKRSVSPGPYGGGPQPTIQSPLAHFRSNSMGDIKQARKEAPGPSSLKPMSTEASKDIPLPIQLPSLDIPRTVGQSQTGSVPSSPVTRKPVPKKE